MRSRSVWQGPDIWLLIVLLVATLTASGLFGVGGGGEGQGGAGQRVALQATAHVEREHDAKAPAPQGPGEVAGGEQPSGEAESATATAGAGAGAVGAGAGDGDGEVARAFVGFAMAVHHTNHLPLYLRSLDQMRAMGVESVLIATPIFQTDGSTADLHRAEGPGRGPTLAQLRALIGRARAMGMRTALMPTVMLTNPRDEEWRGEIEPADWGAWWDAYERCMEPYVELARQEHVDLFVVGSELLSTESQEARWLALIKSIRSRFPGRLTYSANWDHYQVPMFWHALDYVGINGYWGLVEKDGEDAGDPGDGGDGGKGPVGEAAQLEGEPGGPSGAADGRDGLGDEAMASMVAVWEGLRDELLAYSAAQGLPLLMTEVGYPSLPWALEEPWNYVRPAGQKAQHDGQLAGYRAFRAAWEPVLGFEASAEARAAGRVAGRAGGSIDERVGWNAESQGPAPRVAGVFFYCWDPYYHGGDSDAGYGVRGKPAGQLLRDWFMPAR